jgi:hypothetical protein
MSQFIEKLSQLSQGTTQPIGFRPRQPTLPRPKIQLVASLAQEEAESLVNHITGADAALLRISSLSSGSQTLKKMSQAVADIPWGGWLKTSGQSGISPLIKAGCDFVVFPTSAPLTVFNKGEVGKIGKILEVETSLSDGLLRVLNGLPVDAVFLAAEEKTELPLTWQHLMLFQRLGDWLTKPLLVPVPAKITADELQALWAAGVDGVVVAVTSELSSERFQELRQVINELPFPTPRRRGKPEPLLPRIRLQTGVEEEEEEEEG